MSNTTDPTMTAFVQQVDALSVVMRDTLGAFHATLPSPHSMSNAETRIAAQLVQLQTQVDTTRARAHQLARYEVRP